MSQYNTLAKTFGQLYTFCAFLPKTFWESYLGSK